MKKLIPVLVYSLLSATSVVAQSYNVRWVDRINMYNVTAVVEYDIPEGDTAIAVVSVRDSLERSPWWQVRETLLVGQGTDTIRWYHLGGGNPFWTGMAKILHRDGTPHPLGEIMLFEKVRIDAFQLYPENGYVNRFPEVGLVTRLSHWLHFRENQHEYRRILWCSIWNSQGFRDTVALDESSRPMPPFMFNDTAWFHLPEPGEYSVQWWYTDEHITSDPHFGEITIFRTGIGTINIRNTTGIHESRREAINVFPNPCKDMVFVVSEKATEYSLSNLTGQIVVRGQLVPGRNEVDTSRLAPGMYILHTPGHVAKVKKE